jgi:hypothetical protein
MKPGAPLLFLTIAAVLAIQAQEATDLDLHGRRAEPAPSPVPETSPNSTLPELSQLDETFKQSSLGKEADERRMHIEWRQLANRMTNDPDVIRAKKSADEARTDLEKRERLRAYYNLYYGRMRALASGEQMKRALDAVKEEHLTHINQPRVRHETDGALPTPAATPRHRHK